VKRGQVLFIIDQVPYQAALATARANMEAADATLATAQLTYDSKKELFAQNVISAYELKTAENNLLMAKAGRAQAKAQELSAANDLSYTEVKKSLGWSDRHIALSRWYACQCRNGTTTDYRIRQLGYVCLLLNDGKPTLRAYSPIWF